MQVWLVRHAVAAEREEFSGPDEERPLTARGRKKFRDFVAWLASQTEPPALIATSPLVRAMETAEILAKGLGIKKKEIVSTENLSPGSTAGRLIEFLCKQTVPSVALVGHEPDLGQCLAELVGGGSFAFGKGFIAAIEFPDRLDQGAGRLRWFVGPKLTAP